MASNFYSKLVPDYGDYDNVTGNRPARLVEIVENDGGIGLSIYTDSLGRGEHHSVFFNVQEAKDFLASLREAINRAEPKDAQHENRVKEPPAPEPITMTVTGSNGKPETITI